MHATEWLRKLTKQTSNITGMSVVQSFVQKCQWQKMMHILLTVLIGNICKNDNFPFSLFMKNTQFQVVLSLARNASKYLLLLLTSLH